MVQSNMYKYLSILLDARERFEEEDMAKMQRQAPCDGNTEAGNIKISCFVIFQNCRSFSTGCFLLLLLLACCCINLVNVSLFNFHKKF